jgi:biopolymer transport protein ExbB
VSAAGTNTTVFVNGVQYSTVAAGTVATIGGATIGKDSEGTAAGFAGELDELKLTAGAMNPAQVKFAYVNQGTAPDAAKLIVIGAEEAAHVEHEGIIMEHVNLLVDISKDLTIDGWAVIIACTILAIVGGIVAFGKMLYLNKIDKASAAFLKRWEKLSANLTAIDEADSGVGALADGAGGKALRLMKQSPLYRIYHLGSDEIQKRLDSAGGKFSGLSGRSIQAIKAALHGGLVREVQKLNGQLVFLTIGIAGGPYLGLLGTVIGVMITFAVIAKSGEVEVNSIAPGIAGALLATVAGLAVAIPCLFAYSYIATRIKDVVSDMETFIDEFIAKMAEHYKETAPGKEPLPAKQGETAKEGATK